MSEVMYYINGGFCVRLDHGCYLTKSGDVWFDKCKSISIPVECLWNNEREADMALEQYNRKMYGKTKPQKPDTYVQVDGKTIPVSEGVAKKAIQMMEQELNPKFPTNAKVSDLEFSLVVFHNNPVDFLVEITKSNGLDDCDSYTIQEAKQMIKVLQGYVDFALNQP